MSSQEQTGNETTSSSHGADIHIMATLTDEQIKPLHDLGFSGEVGVAMAYRDDSARYNGFRPVIRFSQDDRLKTDHPEICEVLTRASWVVESGDDRLRLARFEDTCRRSEDPQTNLWLSYEAGFRLDAIPSTQAHLVAQLSRSTAGFSKELAGALNSVLTETAVEAVHALPFYERHRGSFTPVTPDRQVRDDLAREMLDGYLLAVDRDGSSRGHIIGMIDAVRPKNDALLGRARPPTHLDSFRSAATDISYLAQDAVIDMCGLAADVANDISSAAESTAVGVRTFVGDTVEEISGGGWMSTDGDPKSYVKLSEL